MTEAELKKELGILTKNKDKWKEAIPYSQTYSVVTEGIVKEL